MTDGSTSEAVIVEELVYILFITNEGYARTTFLSIVTPNHTNAEGWIAHKFVEKNIGLQNYGVFILHLESLAQNKFPLHFASYLDIFTPLKVLCVSMQKDEHDPVFMQQRVQEFNWTMFKLQILVENLIDKTTCKQANYTKLLTEITEN